MIVRQSMISPSASLVHDGAARAMRGLPRRTAHGRDRHPNGLRLGNPRLRAKPRARSGIAGAARSALHGSSKIAENRAQLLTFPFQIGKTFFRFGLLEEQHKVFSLLSANGNVPQYHYPFAGSFKRDLGLTMGKKRP